LRFAGESTGYFENYSIKGAGESTGCSIKYFSKLIGKSTGYYEKSNIKFAGESTGCSENYLLTLRKPK
jgi:hypothetical protein